MAFELAISRPRKVSIEIIYLFMNLTVVISLVCQHLTIIHKSNVLSITDGLFRETVKGVPFLRGIDGKYDSVTVAEQLVDSAVYRYVRISFYDA